MRTALIVGAALPLFASCASQPANQAAPVLPSYEEQRLAREQEEIKVRDQRIAMAKPFQANMANPTAHEVCLSKIKNNLLDPTSFKLTGEFEPDPLWLSAIGYNYDEPNVVKFSAKMLARNKGGNIAPARAMCYYHLKDGQLAFETGFAFNG